MPPIARVVDLLDPALNTFANVDLDEARRRVLRGDPASVRAIDGSFALVASEGITVRLARSMDRPMRYFLAKRHEGPALYVADRIDTLHAGARGRRPRRAVPSRATRAWCRRTTSSIWRSWAAPIPIPVYTRFFTPQRGSLPADLDEIGRRYIGALADEIAKWLQRMATNGADRRRVLGRHRQRVGVPGHVSHDAAPGPVPGPAQGVRPERRDGPDVEQARAFLSAVGLSLFLEEIRPRPASIDACETVRVLEDYKPLDVECATMGLQLCRGIRERYPEWRHLADGDGGDENLKDYPIEENTELTIRSVVDNLMLYQEGWGVGRIKHSLTYSGGLSRSYVRTYAPARRYGFEGFSPYTRPDVMEVAEGIPFAALTRYDVPTLYSLKGEIVRRGVKAVTGIDMPIFPKRRFQHGAMPADAMRARIGDSEAGYRRTFHALYG